MPWRFAEFLLSGSGLRVHVLFIAPNGLSREQRKQQRLIRQARFKLRATIQEIDYQHPRNITQKKIAGLAQGDWISRGQNLLLTGPCESGKT